MNVIVDGRRLKFMAPSMIWSNYMKSMDAAIAASNSGDNEAAHFYMAIARVSLDVYFNSIEPMVDPCE